LKLKFTEKFNVEHDLPWVGKNEYVYSLS